MVRRKVLGWGKKIFQYERGLEITGKLETRKSVLLKKVKIKSNIVL